MILIIGYGNPLRGDDAIGQRIAHLMEERLQTESVGVAMVHQLTPELVDPVSHAEVVIFIDARVGEPVGKVAWEQVEPVTGGGAFTHNVSPATLLGAAVALYGAKPVGILISIVGASFDYGIQLSQQLEEMQPLIADQVEAIINASRSLSNEESSHYA